MGLIKFDPLIKFNPNHVPGGSPEGGQFASGEGGGGSAKPAPIKFRGTEGVSKSTTQPWNTKAEIYEKAGQAKEQFESWLDKGTGIVNQVGGQRIMKSPSDMTVQDWQKPGAFFFAAGLKGEARAEEKTNGENGGQWNRLLDVVRGTIAVDTVSEVRDIVSRLEDSGMAYARLPKDRLADAVQGGWRGDVLMNFRMPNGFVTELQVGLKSMFEAKFVGGGHKIYEDFRSIAAKYPDVAPENFPAADRAKWQALDHQSRTFYGKYWDRTAKEGLLKMDHTPHYVEADGNYYRMVGALPAGVLSWKTGEWGVPTPDGSAKAATEGVPVEPKDIKAVVPNAKL